MTLNEKVVSLCKERRISQSELERSIGISKGSVTKWKTQEPKYSTLEKVAAFFNVPVSSLTNESYYSNEETAQMAQEIFENKELRLLFSAARDASPEDLKTTHDMLMALKRKERGYNDDTGA